MLILISALTLFYIIILLILIRGVSQLHEGRSQQTPAVSVIVAARNEEQNIAACLRALAEQDYPAVNREIIVVDDRSTDGTAEIIHGFIRRYKNIRLLRIKETPAGIAPKKYAIQQGIRTSENNILLFTDADCVPRRGWIRSIVGYFSDDAGLVAGFSPLDRARIETIFTKLMCLDSLSLAAVAAGSFGIGFPLTCNARNLAYRKSVYEQVNGFEDIKHLVSGDDDLFLHKVRDNTDWQIKYAVGNESIVSSNAPQSFGHFMNQRLRHASKGKHYSTPMIAGLAAVYIFNLLLLLLTILSFWSPHLLKIFIGAFIVKSCSEFILLLKTARLFSFQSYLKYFPVAAILHIPYVTIFGLWGQLGKFQWKGAAYHAEMKSESEPRGN
ncbi:glycosyltransferase [candidate division KSB1 bacterium]|nr:glycosyltransferase [candidate division KSB1 bacterium]